MKKLACFLLIKTNLDARKVLGSIKQSSSVVWANNVFGPYQIVAYVETSNLNEIIDLVESYRSKRFIVDLDARICKTIPEDKDIETFTITKKQSAVLIINVNYKEEKERIVTCNLRKLSGIKWARAMWGPTDIIAIVEADDHESMRNIICDDVKTMKGISSNTTFYCYSD